MIQDSPRDQWSRKVPRHLIRQLYRGDALGLLDAELVDDVAYRLYGRCIDLLERANADPQALTPKKQTRVVERPPAWEGFVKRQRYPWEIGWRVDLADYAPGSPLEVVAYYAVKLPAARTPREKKILINRLVHECHESLRSPPEEGAPLAVEIIAGGAPQILALLDELAAGSRTMPPDAL
jgi:hypothetical protein